jgi:ABC-2 type transport system ATP-binding protein
MRLFGQPVPQALPQVIDRIGAVVEAPKFSPHFTGRQNLLLLARSMGAATSRVDAAVETVSLGARADDRYRSYSLGMKQRLTIEATLLKNPQLLILDEPTNGLDPAGIRGTIRALGATGVTVLLSSHILAEVQHVCSSATIISNGRLLASGRVDDLIGAGTSYRVVTADSSAALTVLTTAGLVAVAENGALRVDCETPPSDITKILASSRIYLSELTPARADLETVFLKLTAVDALGNLSDQTDSIRPTSAKSETTTSTPEGQR